MCQNATSERETPDCDRDEDGDVDDGIASGCNLRAVCLVRAMTTDVCVEGVVGVDGCCSRWRMWMLSGWRESRRRRQKKDIGAGAILTITRSAVRFPALVTV